MKPDKSIVQETEHSMTDLRRPTAAAVPPPNRVRVASAYLFPNGPYRDLALRYGWLFLRNSYKAADSPFLGRPDSLLGGFRDSLAELDVQVDSVQHIGCALLGIESLLTGDAAPGSLP